MYRMVVRIWDGEGPVQVDEIDDIGNVAPTKQYNTIDDMPKEYADKVKQLMWLSEDDSSFNAGLGSRVGKYTYWVC